MKLNISFHLSWHLADGHVEEVYPLLRPDQVALHASLTLETVAEETARLGQPASLQFVAQLPAPSPAVLDAHACQQIVEREHIHAPRCSQLCRRQAIFTLAVEQLQGAANDFVRALHDFLLREHVAIGILGGDVAACHANLRQNLARHPALERLRLW